MSPVQWIATNFVNPSTWIGALVYAALMLVIVFILARALRIGARKLLDRGVGQMLDRTAVMFLVQLGQIAIFIVGLMFYAHLVPPLRQLGTALLAGVSIASVVIGLAAQSTLGNLIAGISLLLYRPFEVGDQLQVSAPTGLETGVVESLSLGYTVLQTQDNRRVVVPNSTIASQVTVNLTIRNPRLMVSVPIPVGYASDLEAARRILLELAHSLVDAKDVVDCPVTKLAPSGVELTLRAWCPDPGAAKQFEFKVYEQAKLRLTESGIEIPYPYTNVILKKEA